MATKDSAARRAAEILARKAKHDPPCRKDEIAAWAAIIAAEYAPVVEAAGMVLDDASWPDVGPHDDCECCYCRLRSALKALEGE